MNNPNNSYETVLLELDGLMQIAQAIKKTSSHALWLKQQIVDNQGLAD